jgi:hypothetical protein
MLAMTDSVSTIAMLVARNRKMRLPISKFRISPAGYDADEATPVPTLRLPPLT